MAGDSTVNFNLLHRTCKLVVLLCLLHISVTVVFYVRSLDIRFAFAQNQQTRNAVTQLNPGRTTLEPEPEGPADRADEKKAPELPPQEEKAGEPEKTLEKCPETSPLLGKTDESSSATVTVKL